MLVILTSGGRVTWLARAYAIAIAFTLLLKLAALIRLRRLRPGPRPFRAPFNLRWRGREWPVGLVAAFGAAGAGRARRARRRRHPLDLDDQPAGRSGRRAARAAGARGDADGDELDAFELLPSTELALGQVEARPGNVLVPVRRPQSLAHLGVALQTPRDRDIVVMTARLLGIDVDDDAFGDTTPTPAERRLFSQVVALAERYDRPVRLLIVPTRDVFEAVASDDRAAAIRRGARRRVVVAVRRRAGASARRSLGSTPRSPRRCRRASSSTTTAAAPTPITSARIRRRSPLPISI